MNDIDRGDPERLTSDGIIQRNLSGDISTANLLPLADLHDSLYHQG